MSAYLLPGVLGLLTGLLLRWTGLDRQEGLRHALGLYRRKMPGGHPARSALTALGWAMTLTALLCWLAVIDVDTIGVLPLSLGALLGGVLLGLGAGLCGFTPTTAFAGLGSGRALEALCVLAGCGAMTWLLPSLEGLLSPLRMAPPYLDATLFRVTLDKPWLLDIGQGSFDGGLLGQACAGLLLAGGAMLLWKPESPVQKAEEAAPEREEEDAPAPESAGEEAVVIALEGEEPLVVDTGLDEREGPPADAAPGEEPTEE